MSAPESPGLSVAWRPWAGGLLAYVLAWVLLPAWLAPSFPLDVVEGIAWGHEWQWGYYKHPPMPAWLLYPAFWLLGGVGPYLVSQLSILLALYFVYRLARDVLGDQRAWLAAALPYAIYYYTWPTLEFNHNIAQIPVWAALAWFCHRAVQHNRPSDWLWLGVWAGLGVLTKYSVGVFLLCLAAYLLLKPQRPLWRGAGPWLAIASASVVAAPHLLWLLAHEALPLTYLASRSAQTSVAAAAGSVLTFFGAQLLAHLPLLVVVAVAGIRMLRWRLSHVPPSQRAWLITIGVAPALLTVLVALLSGASLHDMWGTPMWNFSGLLLLAGLPVGAIAPKARAVLRALAVWMVMVTVVMALYLAFGAQWRGKPSRMDWPAQALADRAAAQWHALSTCPLQLVAGESWLASLVAEGTAPMPSILIAGDTRFSPWVTRDRLRRQGALLVWAADQPEPTFAGLTWPTQNSADWRVAEGQWSIAWPRGRGQAPLHMRWRSYVPARCAQ